MKSSSKVTSKNSPFLIYQKFFREPAKKRRFWSYYKKSLSVISFLRSYRLSIIMIKLTVWIFGKVWKYESSVFRPRSFIKKYDRKVQIWSHDKFWAISVFKTTFKKSKRSKIEQWKTVEKIFIETLRLQYVKVFYLFLDLKDFSKNFLENKSGSKLVRSQFQGSEKSGNSDSRPEYLFFKLWSSK